MTTSNKRSEENSCVLLVLATLAPRVTGSILPSQQCDKEWICACDSYLMLTKSRNGQLFSMGCRFFNLVSKACKSQLSPT